MHDANAPADEPESTLPAIEFQSPGRFRVHNPDTATQAAERDEPAPFALGAHAGVERFEGPEQARAHALALCQQARRSVCIYSVDLDPWLYHRSAIQHACSTLLLANPRNQMRILVRDVSRAVKDGHRLLALSRRLSSNLSIRKLHPDYPVDDVAFLLADDCGLLLRSDPTQAAGLALYNDPQRVRLRQSQFDHAWQTSLTDPDLRSFLL